MPSQLGAVLRFFSRAAGSNECDAQGDGQLLRQFASRRDEVAFAALLQRHGPLVFEVCRRLLGDRHDAEDAFQATFLVLARKAGSVRRGEALAAWLHRVALNVSRTLRAWSGGPRELRHPSAREGLSTDGAVRATILTRGAMRNASLATLVVLAGLGLPAPGRAYMRSYLTLGKVMADSAHILVLQVDRVGREKRIVVFKRVSDLKGKGAAEEVKQRLTEGFHPRQARAVLDWAEPGKAPGGFQTDRVCLTCLGDFWYECVAGEASWWTITTGQPELP
jgi:hypothetical protein